jgi:diguanylate cyclase (GGDEF)-like protein
MVHKYSGWCNAKKIWVCLCDASEELTEEERNLGDMRTEYTNTMVLRSVQKLNGTMEWKETRFDRRELIPEEERSEMETGSFFFIPLHYKNHNQGYVAVAFDRTVQFNDFMQGWIMNFSVALQNYYLHERLDAMNDIERMYKEDTLTGIANRRGFEEKARKIYRDAATVRKRVAVLSVDMDNLKKINDVYGHAAGDDALRRIGNALANAAGQRENIVYARTGGDEFVVVCRIDQPGEGEELVIRIREELQKINKQRSQAYSAEVSCGLYEVKDASKVALAKALEVSDERMYEDKRQRKAQQR